MKQTAVQFLVDNLHYLHSTKWDDILDQAKEMEKEQIVDFAYVIADDLADGVFRDKEAMEKRYDEFLTFKSEEDDSKNS